MICVCKHILNNRSMDGGLFDCAPWLQRERKTPVNQRGIVRTKGPVLYVCLDPNSAAFRGRVWNLLAYWPPSALTRSSIAPTIDTLNSNLSLYWLANITWHRNTSNHHQGQPLFVRRSNGIDASYMEMCVKCTFLSGICFNGHRFRKPGGCGPHCRREGLGCRSTSRSRNIIAMNF